MNRRVILPLMYSLTLFEDDRWRDFLPLVYWRTVFELRVGRKVLLDRTPQRLGLPITGIWTRAWLAAVAGQRCGAPANKPVDNSTVLVNGRWVFDGRIDFPKGPCVGMVDDEIAYVVCDKALAKYLTPEVMLNRDRCREALEPAEHVPAEGRMLSYPWDLVRDVGDYLTGDWGEGDASIEGEIDGRRAFDPHSLHVGQRSRVHATAILDTSRGPIFVSHDVSIGAFAVVEGPAYIGSGSKVHPYTRLHGGNSIGPVCRIGGEVHACVIDGYSNKQHEGFLGHCYVGNWVNVGAGCNNSDLKNTYGSVRIRLAHGEVDSGEMFLGAIIGDHAKVGINASIPTGAVIGFAASVATSRVLPRWVPSFSWITEEGCKMGDPGRLLDVATKVMTRRGIDMTDEEVELFLDLGTRAPTLESRD